MKVTTPEISWHGRDPVYSVDFQLLNGDIRRLATCGTDRNIRLWEVKLEKDGSTTVDFLATLSRHTRTVNVVRFSPDGQVLASAGDDSVVMLWRKNDMPPSNNIFAGDEDDGNKENWSTFKTLRSHLEDIYDISWSCDGKYLLSGSVDNSAILWDAKKACRIGIFPDHKSFVQGVAFDPRGEFLATMSSDRCCRIFGYTSKNCLSTISKLTLPNQNATEEKEKAKGFRMFHDDTMKSFFRRLTFTPDGSLLIVPAGCIEQAGESTVNTTFVFTRSSLSKPVMHLPGPKKATLAVRCCPVQFELRKVPRKTPLKEKMDENGNELKEWEKYETMFGLPYRMVFAIASEDSILLHDTQQPQPFAFISNIHYHQLSDLAWSPDGRLLVASSTDGYCTLITFDEGELGKPCADQIFKVKTKAEVEEDIRVRKTDRDVKKAKKNKKKDSEKENANDKDSTGKPMSPKREDKKPQISTPSRKDTTTAATTTPKRRITVQTLATTPSSSAKTTPSKSESVDCVAAALTPTSRLKAEASTKSPRRVAVTTLETMESSDTKVLEPTDVEDEDGESNLHLVLEETCDASQMGETTPSSFGASTEKSADKPVTPKPDKNAPKRRIAVTTLETFPSSSQ